jgi:hypothetical protein
MPFLSIYPVQEQHLEESGDVHRRRNYMYEPTTLDGKLASETWPIILAL